MSKTIFIDGVGEVEVEHPFTDPIKTTDIKPEPEIIIHKTSININDIDNIYEPIAPVSEPEIIELAKPIMEDEIVVVDNIISEPETMMKHAVEFEPIAPIKRGRKSNI